MFHICNMYNYYRNMYMLISACAQMGRLACSILKRAQESSVMGAISRHAPSA